MRIVGPGSSGNWGTLAAGGAVGSNDALNAWQFGYSYFAVNSANTPGVLAPGYLDGLNFNPNTLGDYQFEIAVRGGQTGPILGSTTMTVSVVPAPGAIAVLGLTGLSVRRRRNMTIPRICAGARAPVPTLLAPASLRLAGASALRGPTIVPHEPPDPRRNRVPGT